MAEKNRENETPNEKKTRLITDLKLGMYEVGESFEALRKNPNKVDAPFRRYDIITNRIGILEEEKKQMAGELAELQAILTEINGVEEYMGDKPKGSPSTEKEVAIIQNRIAEAGAELDSLFEELKTIVQDEAGKIAFPEISSAIIKKLEIVENIKTQLDDLAA